MNQKTKTIIKSFSFLLVFAIAIIAIQAFAVFTPPDANPVGNNTATPILSNNVLQIKPGGIIFGFMRVISVLLVGGPAEFSGTIKIYGGDPAPDRVLVSDAVGLASWRDASTLPGWGGGNGNLPSQGVVPVSLGGTGLTTIPAHSIWVANTKDVITTLTPGAGQSIRLNSAGNTWEAYTPSTGGGGIDGNGTTNYLAKFINSTTLGNSTLFELNNKIGIGTLTPEEALHIMGNARISGLAGSGDRQVCVDPDGKLKACTTDVTRVITFSVKVGTNSWTVLKTRILYSNDPADLGKDVKLCNLTTNPYKFTAHFDLVGNSCTASSGVNIDSSDVVSAQFIAGNSLSKERYIVLSNFDSADKIEFASLTASGYSPLMPGDEVYFLVQWPSVSH